MFSLKEMSDTNPTNPNIQCYFDIKADEEPLGRIVFELFQAVAPITVGINSSALLEAVLLLISVHFHFL